MKNKGQESYLGILKDNNKSSPLNSQKNFKFGNKSPAVSGIPFKSPFKSPKNTFKSSKENLISVSSFKNLPKIRNIPVSPFSKKYSRILKTMKEPYPVALNPCKSTEETKEFIMDFSLIKPSQKELPTIAKELKDLKSQMNKMKEKLKHEESRFIERSSENNFLKTTILSLQKQLDTIERNGSTQSTPLLSCVNCVIT